MRPTSDVGRRGEGARGADASGPVIVKLGGSVLTRKRESERARPKVLERLARELLSARVTVLLLHGAGSFGHPGAHRFGLARAPANDAESRRRTRGAAIVATEVRRLHLAVLQALLRAGGAPVSIPLATTARNRSGQLEEFDPGPFERALAQGALPVSFGDVVPDETWGYSILSADTVAVELARRFRPPRVLFVSDVAGVLDRAPGRKDRVIPEVTADVVRALAATATARDVTGGIRAKAEAMLAIAGLGAEVGLISGLTDGALARAIRGETVYGSWARAASA